MSPESKRKAIEIHRHKPWPQADLLQMHTTQLFKLTGLKDRNP
jgi:hypothetical protein